MMGECKHELICPKCNSDEVYYENANTGSCKYTCQDCEFMGNKEDFNYSIPVKDYDALRQQVEELQNKLNRTTDEWEFDIVSRLTYVKDEPNHTLLKIKCDLEQQLVSKDTALNEVLRRYRRLDGETVRIISEALAGKVSQ